MLHWIPPELLPVIRAKPIPGIDRPLGTLLMWAFLITVVFTGAGIPVIDLFFPLDFSIALLLSLAAWVLFLLFFSAGMFLLVLKGFFF
jgi:hypothetical protein